MALISPLKNSVEGIPFLGSAAFLGWFADETVLQPILHDYPAVLASL